MKRRVVVVLALLCLVSGSRAAAVDIPDEFKIKREAVFEFAQKPVVTRQGDVVTIVFESKAFCDATVAVEDAGGRIVRHLASGVLGPKAPEPFQPDSKKQTLVWDGKDDQGTYVDDKNAITVRVSLGLKPRYERPLFWEPKKRISQAVPLIRAAPEGVYVFDSWGLDHLRLFDRDGNYVRTVYPFPAGKLNDVQGLSWQVFPQDGQRLPLKMGYHEATLLTSGTTGVAHDAYKLGTGIGAYSMDVRNGTMALAGLRLNRLATDGSSGGRPIYGPEVYTFRKPGMTLNHYEKTYVPPSSAALSPDGKWLYLAGYAWRLSGDVGCHHGVMRVAVDGDQAAEPFLGSMDPAQAGTVPGQFQCATSVDCDGDGRIYVSDYMNDRIQVFAPDGKFLKAIATPRPVLVRLHRKTGEIYCFSWVLLNRQLVVRGSYGTVDVKPTLTVFGPFADPAKRSQVDLPLPAKEGYNFYMGQDGHALWYTAEVDSWANPPVIWLGKESINNTTRGLASGDGGRAMGWESRGIQMLKLENGKLEKVHDFGADTVKSVVRARPPDYFTQRLYVNPANHKLYVGEGDSDTDKSVAELLEIDPETTKIRPFKLPFAAEDLCFDLNGLVYLRTHWEVVRYEGTSGSWDEVPWDYGEERDTEGGGALTALSVLPTPSIKPMCFHQNGMWINPKGHLTVSCVNYKTEYKKAFDGGYANVTARGNYEAKAYLPRLYPGRARWNEVHIWDKHGKVIREDVVPGLHMHEGLAIDKNDNVYVLATGTRMLGGQKFFDVMSGTLMKVTPGKAKIVSTGAVMPLTPETRPQRPADMDSPEGIKTSWVEGADWLYGGVGYIGWNAWDRGGRGCGCCRTRFTLDLFDRVFAPEIGHHSVAVLDTRGNLILRVGQYGNEDEGLPLAKAEAGAGGQPVPRSIGGDEVALMHGAYLATDTDRRLFIADPGNARIVSVKLGYHAEEKIALKDVKDEGKK